MKTYSLDDLLTLMARLRDPETGCPWDIAQNYASIAPSTLEEAYEVVDAIEKQDWKNLKEELGDLLFQVIFYSQLGAEEDRFNFHQIVSDLVAKLIRRHPHVFPEGTLESQVASRHLLPDDVKVKWEAIKKEERAAKGAHSLLADVPVGLPSLSRAQKLQKRASSVGFDWADVSGPLAKLKEEIQELEEAIDQKQTPEREEELGDLLFSVVNVARHLKLDPEQALRKANQKFEQRFGFVETNLHKPWSEANLQELDALWDKAKSQEK